MGLVAVLAPMAVNLFAGWREPTNMLYTHGHPLFANVIGCDEAKNQMRAYVNLLRSPYLARDVGLKGVPGLVFYGPEGTGKRTLAHAAANEANARFTEVDMEQLLFADVLDGYQTIESLFNESSNLNAPTVIFVKRADVALPFSRGPNADEAMFLTVRSSHASDSEEMSRSEDQRKNELLLHSLLQEHEVALEAGSRLLLVLSCRGQLRRPWEAAERFEQIHFSNPDSRTRALLFSKKFSSNSFSVKSDDALVQRLARSTHGLNGRDISRIFQMAALRSASRDICGLSPLRRGRSCPRH